MFSPKTRKRLRRIVGVVLGLVLIVVAVFALGLFPQEPLRRFLEARIGAALGPDSHIGRLHVVPGRLSAEARDLHLVGPGFVLDVPVARVTLSPGTLVGKAFALRSLELQRPVLTFTREAPPPGSATAPPPPGEAPAASRPVLLGNVAITNGTIIYHDQALTGDWQIDDVSLTGSIGRGALRLSTGPAVWKRPQNPVQLASIHADLSISTLLAVDLASLVMATERSQITAKGSLGTVYAIDPKLDLDIRLDLREAAEMAALPGLRGQITGRGHVSGLGDTLRTDADLSGQEIEVQGQRIEGAQIHLVQDAQSTRVRLSGRALGGETHADATLHGTEITATVKGEGFDLRALAALSGNGASAVSGRASLDLSARGRLGERVETIASLEANGVVDDVRVGARAAINGAVLGKANRLDWTWNVDGTAEDGRAAGAGPRLAQARFNATGTAQGVWPPAVSGRLSGSGRVAAGTAGAHAFSVDGTLQNQAAQMSANLDLRGDLGLVNVVANRTPETTRVDVEGHDLRLERVMAGAQGQVAFSFHGSGQGESFRGTGEGHLVELQWQQAAVGNVDVQVTTRGRETALELQAPAWKITGHGTVAPASRRSPALVLSAELQLNDTPLAGLAPFMGREQPLDGHARGQIQIDAPLATPAAARVSGTIEELALDAEPLHGATRQAFTFEATQERVDVHDLTFAGEGIDLKASGSFGMTGARRLQATLDGTADLARLPFPPGVVVSGTSQAQVEIAGTVQVPQVTGVVDLHDVRAQGPSLPETQIPEARLDLQGDTIHLRSTDASFAGGSVTVGADLAVADLMPTTPRRPARTTRLELTFKGVDATQLHLAAAPGTATPVTGTLDGRARFEGSLLDPRHQVAEVEMPEIALALGDVPLRISRLQAQLENGQLRWQPLEIETTGGTLRVDGHVDTVARTLAVSAKGGLDLRALSPMLEEVSLAGRADVALNVEGPLAAPRPSGTVTLRGGSVYLKEIQPPLTDIAATVTINGGAVTIAPSEARWGGGTLVLSGSAALAGAALRDVRLDVKGKDLGLRYRDARMRLDADVALTGSTGDYRLTGSVDLVHGLYDRDIFLGEGLTAGAVPMAADSPALHAIALDLRLQTREAFLVRNNLAQIQGWGRLRVRGDAQDPAPFGTFRLGENGKVFLQGHEMRLEGGTITYTGSLETPTLDITVVSAKAIKWRETDTTREAMITAHVHGDLARPLLDLSSDTDDLKPAEIASLLATGRPNPGRERGSTLVGEQAAVMLAGPLSQRLSRNLKRLGFDEVTIEPALLARSQDPTARFTFGKNLTDWSSLLYSASLDDAEERFFLLRLHPVGAWSAEVQRDEDGSVTTRASHVLRLGRPPRRGGRAEQKTRVETVKFEGRLPAETPEVQAWIDLKPGTRVTYWDLQNRSDRVRQKLAERGFIEADVSARLEGSQAIFRFRAGPRYTWQVTGMTSPPDLRREVTKAVFADEAFENGEKRLLQELHRRGYFAAQIHMRSEGGDDQQTLQFEVVPGPPLEGVDVVFDGAAALKRGDLLKAAGGESGLITQPGRARRQIEERYHDAHYLQAEIGLPEITTSGRRALVKVPVKEGPSAVVVRVEVTGPDADEAEVRRELETLVGRPPDALRTHAAVQAIRDRYFRRGYPDVRVRARLHPDAANLELQVEVDEGKKVEIREIDFKEPLRVDSGILARELPIHVGDPYDPRKLTLAESRLSKFGFSRVTIAPDEKDPERIVVETRPKPRLTSHYALEYGTGTGFGGSIDVETPNLTRFGWTPGASYRYGAFEKTARLWMKRPAFLHRGTFTLGVARQDVDLSSTTHRAPSHGEDPDTLLRQHTDSVTALQQIELGGQWQLEYGYELERLRAQTGQFPASNVGKLQVSLLRDTRDYLLDPRRGRFWSLSLAYGPPLLGSDARYEKAFAQFALYRSFGELLTWAQNYRLGVGRGLRGPGFPLLDRFFAGGANSVRGFANESLGPPISVADPAPAGGEAVIVLNQELRAHHSSGLGAAVFWDAGNVYAHASDLGPLRHAIGVGLRYESPVGLLRVDVGTPLRRREGESKYRLFLSLGQAF